MDITEIIRQVSYHSTSFRIIFGTATALLWLWSMTYVVGATRYVAVTGSDGNPGTLAAPWGTVQAAALRLLPGETALIQPGNYNEKVTVGVSGTPEAPILIKANGPLGSVVLDGTGLGGGTASMIDLSWRNYVTLDGLEICRASGLTDASGVRINHRGDGLVIRNCRIHEMRGRNATGISAYGTRSIAITGLRIEQCEVFNCDPFPSEAITMNGNITGFQILDNKVHDVNYIGIDAIGGESSVQPITGLVARFGSILRNRVWNCNRPHASTDLAVGIYLDGARYCIVEGNVVTGCDIGIEVGAENRGANALANVIRTNIVTKNISSGLIVGGADEENGRTTYSRIYNNVFYRNGPVNSWTPEILIQYGWRNEFINNAIMAHPDANRGFIWVEGENENQTFNNNLFYADSAGSSGSFGWGGSGGYDSYTSWIKYTGQNSGGAYANPGFIDPENGNFHLALGAYGINRGKWNADMLIHDAGFDFEGFPRIWDGAPDVGPDEHMPVDRWFSSHFPGEVMTYQRLSKDSDGDDSNEWLEYAAGTNPILASDSPQVKITPLTVAGVDVRRIIFPRAMNTPDAVLELEGCTGLRIWQAMPNFPPTSLFMRNPVRNFMMWVIPNDENKDGCRFFRVTAHIP